MADGLSVSNLKVSRSGKMLVHAASFVAPTGQVTALVGPNGAGKSTILKSIMGLIPSQGTIAVNGDDVASLSPRLRAQKMAYVPQHSALEAPLSVRDVVAQGRFSFQSRIWGTLKSADKDAIDWALQRTDTVTLADRSFDRLSYGERRRVLLARALCSRARLLLLDEPTAALDVGHALDALGLLQTLAREGMAVLAVLHPMHEILDFSDRAVVLHDGRIVAEGPTKDVLNAENTARVWGVRLVPGIGVVRVSP